MECCHTTRSALIESSIFGLLSPHSPKTQLIHLPLKVGKEDLPLTRTQANANCLCLQFSKGRNHHERPQHPEPGR